MTALKCIAIDDEPLALELISSYIDKFPALRLVQTFEDALAAAAFLKNNLIDLLLIDINMPDITGIQLVKSLANKPMVIFTTAYKQFAYEGFELEAVDYLLKPIDFKRFSKAIEKALDYYKYKHSPSDQSAEECLYVYSEYRMIKVVIQDIEYIESMEDYIKIHIGTSKPIITLMPLKRVLEKLPNDKFKRIHRSYAINVRKIKSIHNRRIYLNTIDLPLSDTYLNNFRDELRK